MEDGLDEWVSMIQFLGRSGRVFAVAIAAVMWLPWGAEAQRMPQAPPPSSPQEPPIDRLLQQGVTAHIEGRLAEAERLFRAVLRRDPNHALAHRNLGVVLQDQGQLDAAIARFRQAIALNPTLVIAHYDLGFALRDQGNVDEAIAQFRQAIALDPQDALGYYELGNLLQSQGVVTSQRSDEAIGPNPNGSPVVQADVQMTVAMDGHLEEAIAQFRQAIALDPSFVSARHQLGLALLRQGNPEEAIAQFHQAIAQSPHSARLHFDLGRALEQQGSLEAAIAAYEQAIALDPQDSIAQEALRAARERLVNP